MAANYPVELQDALIARNGAQAAMDKSRTQGKKRMNKVADTCYLLRPQEA